MNRTRFVFLLALGLILMARAASASETSLTMASDPGDYVGDGQQYFYDISSAVFIPTLLNFGNGAQVFVNQGNLQHWWYLKFGAADGAALAPGVYVDAQRYSVQAAGHPGIEIYGDGRGCDPQASAFQIKQLTISNGTVTRLWVRFEQHCGGGTPALTGDLRFNADISVIVTSPFGRTLPVGQTVTFDVTARSTVGDHVTLVALGMPSGASFVDHQNNTGTFSWVPADDQVGSYNVTFAGSSDNGQDQSTTNLQISERPLTGDTSLRMESETGDNIGLGQSWSYGATDGSFIGFALNGGAFAEVYLQSPQHTWTLDFGGPGNTLPAPGLYLDARQILSGDPSHPGLSVRRDGSACNTVTGAFEIKQLVVSNNLVKRIWARFGQHCGGGPAALTGEIRLNADVTVAAVAPFYRHLERGQPLAIDVTGSASGGGHVSLGGENLPAGATFVDHGDNTGRLSWTPSVDQIGDYSVVFTADDGLGHVDRSTTLLQVTGLTSLEIISATGEPLARGVDAFYTPADGTFLVSQNFYDNSVRFGFQTPTYSSSWDFDFGGPNNLPLSPGNYDVVAGSGSGTPWMSASGNGAGCGNVTGRFVVRQAEYGPNNTVKSFWATFEEVCFSGSVPLRGEVRFNARVITDVTAPPADTIGPGRPLTFAVTATNAAGRHVVLTAGGLPGGASFVDHGDNTGTFSWTPLFNDIGNYRASFVGNDGAGGVDSAATDLVVPGETSLMILEGPAGQQLLTPENGRFSVGHSADNLVHINFAKAGEYSGWNMDFGAPQNTVLMPGFYPGASIVQVQGVYAPAPTYPVLNATDYGFLLTCSPWTGLFQVKQVKYDPHGNIEGFWATFEEHCSEGKRYVGEIRFNAGVDVAVQAPLSAEAAPGWALAIPVRATDRLGGHIALTASGLPNGAKFIDNGDNSGVLNWTPGVKAVGLHDVSFTGDNGSGGVDRASVHIRVTGQVQFTVNGDPQDPVTFGRSAVFGPLNGQFEVWKNYKEGVSMRFRENAGFYLNYWFLNLAAPHSAPLMPAIYGPVSYYPYESDNSAGLSFTRGYDPCPSIVGQFEIEQITYGPGAEIASLRATFRQQCTSSPAGATGELRWNTQPPCSVVMGVRFEPRTLNLNSNGLWVTVHLAPPSPRAPSDIDVSSIRLNGKLAVDPRAPVATTSHELVVKFSRSAVEAMLSPGDSVGVFVEGSIGPDCFSGADTIRVLKPQLSEPVAGSVFAPGASVDVKWPTMGDDPVDLVSTFDGGSTWNVETHGLPNNGACTWVVPTVASEQARLAVVETGGVSQGLLDVSHELAESGTFSIRSVTAAGERPITFAIASMLPNPARGEFTVNFSLPSGNSATLAVYDIVGRRVAMREVGGMGAGYHAVTFGRDGLLPAGVYLVRLTQNGASLKARVVVIR